jgi:hypothetical protein
MDKQYALKPWLQIPLNFTYPFIPDFLFHRQGKFSQNIIFFSYITDKSKKRCFLSIFCRFIYQYQKNSRIFAQDRTNYFISLEHFLGENCVFSKRQDVNRLNFTFIEFNLDVFRNYPACLLLPSLFATGFVLIFSNPEHFVAAPLEFVRNALNINRKSILFELRSNRLNVLRRF